MPNKRSKHSRRLKFSCPYCASCLWRLGAQNHFLYYSNASEIPSHLYLTRKSATLLTMQGVYIDHHTWLVEFFCGEHGKMWLRLYQGDDGIVNS
jgi:hypothetical protein